MKSESLELEIVDILHTLNESVEKFEVKLNRISQDIERIHKRIDDVIFGAFVDSDLSKHKRQHTPFFKRLFQ